MSASFRRFIPLLGLMFSAAALADGFVILDRAGLDDRLLSLRTTNGRIHAQIQQSWGIFPATSVESALLSADADGNANTGFGQSGWLTLTGIPYGFVDEQLASDGSFNVLLIDRVQRRDTLGFVLAESPPLYTTLATGTTGTKNATVFTRQADGKFIIGGQYGLSAMSGSNYEWTVTRLAADTSALDASFGGGIVRHAFNHGGTNLVASINAIHALSNGQILATGRVQTSSSPSTFETVFALFNSNGSIDGNFGVNGQVVLPDSTGITRVDSTGRIYLAQRDGRVTRFSSAGAPDAGYPGGTGNAQLDVTGLELDSQGRAVVFGSITVSGEVRAHVARLDANGSPDAGFNGTGSNTLAFPLPIPAPSYVSTAAPCVGAIQTSDRPIIACNVIPVGDSNDAPLADLAIARLTSAGQLDATFGTNQVDSDVFPDDFSFPTVMAPYGTANVPSASVTVTGINAPTYFLHDDIAISLGCNGSWQTGMVLLHSGDSFCVRRNAPGTANSSATVGINVGGRISNFVIQSTAAAADTVPDAFSFPTQNAVAPGVLVTSAPITAQGITGNATITVANGYFSLNCDGSNWSGSYSAIVNGTTLCASHYASATSGASTTTTLNIGGTIGTFTSTTEVIDSVPAAFAFTDQTNVALDSPVTSNTLTITGITHAPISITDGYYSIGCNGTFTSTAGTIANNQTVCVLTGSGIALGMQTSTTLDIGGVQDTFSVTTSPVDTTPDAFSFTAQTNATPGTAVLSNTIVVGGINNPAAISVTGGEFSVGCNSFTTTAGTVLNGQSVCLRHTSSSSGSTTVSTTLTIGGVTATFSSTTASSGSGSSSSGGGGGGGSLDPLLLSFALAMLTLTSWHRARRGRVPAPRKQD